MSPSTERLEIYALSIAGRGGDLVLGVPKDLHLEGCTPMVTIRTPRFQCNAPRRGFAVIRDLSIDGVPIVFGAGGDGIDATDLTTCLFGRVLPDLVAGRPVKVTARYTGLVPPGFRKGYTHTLVVIARGPARETAI